MKNFLLFIFCVLVSSAAFGQGTETLESHTLTASYGSGSFVGDNGVTWNYVESRDDGTYAITGKSIMLRQSSNPSSLSTTVAGGIGDFTCDLKKAFTGSGNRQVQLFINGVSYGSSVAFDNTSVQTFSVTGINQTGNVTIEIRNITSKQVCVDNISWTGFSPSTPIATFDAATSSQTETNATFAATIPVTMSNYAGSQVDLSVTVTGGTAAMGDYTLNTTALSFTADGTQNVSIDINPDADIIDETIELTIAETTSTGVILTTSVHTITVSDDDAVSCSVPVWTIVAETLNSESDTWGESSGNYTVNGYVGSASASDLWLVYGPLDMSGTSTLNLNFDLVESFAGDPLNFKYSTDYAGDVSTATWTSVQSLTGSITGASVNYGAATGTNTYIAIQYTATGLGSGGSASYALNNITMEADICPTAPCVIANVAATSACDGDNTDVVVTWTDAGTSGTIEVDINGEGYQTMISGGTYTIVGPTTAATGVTVTVRDANDVTCSATTTVDILECPVYLPIAFINEFHYDDDGTDEGEFVEIAIESSFSGNLADLKVSAYNGNGGVTYDTETLDNLTVGLTAHGFTFYTWAGTGVSGGIQNGNDGFALSYQGTLLEFISYEGAFMATNGDASGVTATDVGVSESSTGPTGVSIQRIGTCTGDCPTGLTWTGPATASSGDINTSQSLPVELLYFSAKPNNQTALLTWATATEENNAYFNIQRSTDGKNFETIGTKTGAGTTYNVQEYSFIDKKPSNGLNYYRLQQVDFDGKFENHKIVSVLMNGKASDVQIYPNPTRGTLNIVLPTTGENEIQILDLTGKIVRTSITNDEGMTTLDISDLANGQYVIKIRNAQAISTALFVKTK